MDFNSPDTTRLLIYVFFAVFAVAVAILVYTGRKEGHLI